MRRGETVTLLEVSGRASTSGWAVAAQVEATLPEIFVHVGEVILPRAERRVGQSALTAPSHLDYAAHLVRELAPRLVAVGCNIWNVDYVLQLCDRLHRLAPRMLIALGGTEAVARREELLRRGDVDRALEGDAATALVTLLHDLSGEPGPAPARGPGAGASGRRRPPPIVTPLQLYQRRVGELVQQGRTSGNALIVEADWSNRIPLCLLPHVRLPGPTLTVEAAARRIQPLHRAGVPVLLLAPEVTGDVDRLQALLDDLDAGSVGQLQLELRAEHLESQSLERLHRAGVRVITLDLTALLRGALDPDRLRVHFEALAQQGIVCRGTLPVGLPRVEPAAFRQAFNTAIQAGLDDLTLERLVVPPGSGLRQDAESLGLVYAGTPPYELLAHPWVSMEEMLRTVRISAALDFLRPALAGTGLLRALSEELGPAIDLVEGFCESMAAHGQDLLEGDPSERPERLFIEYLREVHRIDLDLARGRTRLTRAPLISVRWLSDGRRLITDDSTGRVAQLGKHALALLDRFDQPHTAHEACEQVVADAPLAKRERLRQDVHRTLDKLVSMSFLVPVQQAMEDDLDDHEFPFTCLEEFDYHYRMLTDSIRVSSYRRAIEAAVKEGEHAVEIGTGTGILAVLAAKAGASVTAIERFSVLGIARAVARQSGVADRITFVRGRSDLVELEQRGDVLISELVGNRILNESILENTLDARRRLLKPGARLIPQRIEILAEVGRTDRFDHVQREFERVGQACGVRLDPLARWFEERVAAGQVVWELGADADDFQRLTDEVSVVTLDLRELRSADFSQGREVVPLRSGTANAVVLAFRLELQPGIEISTSGRQHGLHWSKPVFMLRSPRVVRQGEPITVRLSYDTHGELAVSLDPGSPP